VFECGPVFGVIICFPGATSPSYCTTSDKTLSGIWSGFRFAPIGDITGVSYSDPSVQMLTGFPGVSVLNDRVTGISNSNISVHETHGGGLLGDPIFLLLNAGREVVHISDGALHMYRRWAKVILTDLLCRDLPAVRNGDGQPFVQINSSIPFRSAESCMQCHSSMDRMAAVARNLLFVRSAIPGPGNNHSSLAFARMPASLPPTGQDPISPETSDQYFQKRPPTGELYFRSYNGELIRMNINDLSGLGDALSQQKDFYACTAKKYYRYFTGIDATLADLGDSLVPPLTNFEILHRNQVIELGMSLMQHQSTSKLIAEIMKTVTYKTINYGAE